jgi:MFS family permease
MQSQPTIQSAEPGAPWWRGLTRYHWFVLVVAALGWLFDCLDQQLFIHARLPAMKALVPGEDPVKWGGYATSIFLMGWATGGLIFGVIGDRFGRAKTMIITILLYSLCTGLSALSRSFWDFALYRFLTGLGVGGEFAVGVALVAEVMPDRSRAGALGLLQALSAVGNVAAAFIGIGMARLETTGVIATGTYWRWLFVIGALPALLALVIRWRLKEPERWLRLKESGEIKKHSAFTYRELFSSPRWRRNALLGMVLCCSGIIGMWGIVFFTPELIGAVLTKSFKAQGMADGDVAAKVNEWRHTGMLWLQFGAFLGMLTSSAVAAAMGRKKAFALTLTCAMIATAATFHFFSSPSQLWLFFVMGFFLFSIFAVYAIYLPELFPTHLRSTGTSFCYNVGRFVAAVGPPMLGWLKTEVYQNSPEPMRPAAITMCAVFLLGLAVLPFLPETKGQPLPEDERGAAH